MRMLVLLSQLYNILSVAEMHRQVCTGYSSVILTLEL